MGASPGPRTTGSLVPLDALRDIDVRPVPFAIGHFVTADGRVLSAERGSRTVRERRPAPNRGGYGLLYVASIDRTFAVHALVAAVFLPPRPSPAHQVRHLDGDCTNNRADNLAWGTARENIDDRERHGTTARGARNGMNTTPSARRPGERNGNAVLSAEQARAVRVRYANGELRADLAREFGVSWSAVDRLVRGESWRAGGEASPPN